MKQITIESDGSALGTTVFDADGAKIEGSISKIEWSIDAVGRVGEAKITFMAPVVRVTGDLNVSGVAKDG